MRVTWVSRSVAVAAVGATVVTAAVAVPLVAAVSQAVAAPAAAPTVPDPCVLSGVTATCTFQRGRTAWSVPRGIEPGTALTITARGQAGQEGYTYGGPNASGGRGANVSASYVLAPDTPLIVSAPGEPGDGDGSGSSGALGWGGQGGAAAYVVVDMPGTQPDRTLVAAGGGGGGGEPGIENHYGLFPGYLRGGTGGDAGVLGAPSVGGDSGASSSPASGGAGGGSAKPPVGESAGRGGAGGTVRVPTGGGGANNGGCDVLGPQGVAGGSGSYFKGGDAQPAPGADDEPNNPGGGGGGGGYTGGGAGGSGVAKKCPIPPTLAYYSVTSGGGGGGGSSYADPASTTTPTSSIANGPVFMDAGSLVITYQVDVTAPVPTIDDVTSPRTTPVGDLFLDYHEPLPSNQGPGYALTRNGVPVDLSTATYISAPTTGRYGVGLDSQFTRLPGTYVFTVFAAGITDVAGNPVPADVSRTWTTTLVATISQPPTPRADGVDSVDVTFNAPVTGVDLGDFRLFLNGIELSFAGATLTGSGTDYVISGLGDQTRAQSVAAEWEIVLRGTDTGIESGGVGPPPSTFVSFVVDASTPPVGSFGAVASPLVRGPDTIPLTFSQPVYGLDINALRVFRDGIPTALTGATVRCTAPTPQGSCVSYVVEGVGPLFSPELYPVAWELELVAGRSNVTNEAGVALSDGASVAFTVNATPHPTATFTAVSTPRATGVDALALTFSQSVYAVDVTDFVATRNGVPVPLDGAVLTQTGRLPDGSSATFSLSGLSDLTAPGPSATAWTISLRSDNTNITDVEGQPLVHGASTDFYVLAATLPTASFTAVATPRADALDSVALTFSSPVFGLDVADLELTRDGVDVPLTGVGIGGGGASYTVDGLGALTAPGAADSDYVLTLRDSGTGIVGDVGQPLSGGATVGFRVEAAVVGVPTTLTLGRSGTPSWTTASALTATVVAADGSTPAGAVTFTITPSVGRPIACQGGNTLAVASGVATCRLPARTLRPGDGTYVVSAVFSGAGYVASDAVDSVTVPGTPSGLTFSTPSVRRAGQTTSIAVSLAATARRNGAVPGAGRVVVVNSRGRAVPCDRFSLFPSTPTFGCTIPRDAAIAGTYTVYAVYFRSPFDSFTTIRGTLTLS